MQVKPDICVVLGEIADRMGADARLVSQYRLRLIDDGTIQPTARGLVDYTLPYLREHLRQSQGNPYDQ